MKREDRGRGPHATPCARASQSEVVVVRTRKQRQHREDHLLLEAGLQGNVGHSSEFSIPSRKASEPRASANCPSAAGRSTISARAGAQPGRSRLPARRRRRTRPRLFSRAPACSVTTKEHPRAGPPRDRSRALGVPSCARRRSAPSTSRSIDGRSARPGQPPQAHSAPCAGRRVSVRARRHTSEAPYGYTKASSAANHPVPAPRPRHRGRSDF